MKKRKAGHQIHSKAVFNQRDILLPCPRVLWTSILPPSNSVISSWSASKIDSCSGAPTSTDEETQTRSAILRMNHLASLCFDQLRRSINPIRLTRESFKQIFPFFWRQTRSSIFHTDKQPHRRVLLQGGHHWHFHLSWYLTRIVPGRDGGYIVRQGNLSSRTVGCESDSVRDEVGDHLPKTDMVSFDDTHAGTLDRRTHDEF